MRQGKPRKQFYFLAIVNIAADKNYVACKKKKKKRASNESCLWAMRKSIGLNIKGIQRCYYKYDHVHTQKRMHKIKNKPWDQQLNALITLPGEPGAMPSMHMVAHNQLELQFRGIWCLLLAPTSTACLRYKCPLRPEEKLGPSGIIGSCELSDVGTVTALHG